MIEPLIVAFARESIKEAVGAGASIMKIDETRIINALKSKAQRCILCGCALEPADGRTCFLVGVSGKTKFAYACHECVNVVQAAVCLGGRWRPWIDRYVVRDTSS